MVGHSVPLIVGVAGGTGAGKTTISRAILDDVGKERIAYIQHDAYYRDLGHLPMAERRQQNMDHPNALETELLLEHLARLRRWESVEIPVYDFGTYRRLERTTLVHPRPVILVEGILVLATPELRNELDVKVYVDADADIRLIRPGHPGARPRSIIGDRSVSGHCASHALAICRALQAVCRYNCARGRA